MALKSGDPHHRVSHLPDTPGFTDSILVGGQSLTWVSALAYASDHRRRRNWFTGPLCAAVFQI
jgi:hypothetical protein